jgi:membrane protein implicated in regulation of membrane protease activity
MNPFEFAFAIVALVLVVNLIKIVIRQKHMRRPDGNVNAELTQRLHQLEERVQVLERIVTDERFDLKQQFKDL